MSASHVRLHRTGAASTPRGRRARLPGTVVLAAALLGCAGAAMADRDDHQRVRQAVLAGEVLPLPQLLERVQRSHPGQVLELELDREDGRWIYEIKLLQPGGHLVKLDVDARTAEVLKLRGRDTRGPDRTGR
ncbi:MAG: PepSY domain-containing protein [Gammaproteobacteria bacterium]|uniref:PepSY domain-containing protein n=1 Tax=Azohydromonas sp. TaxID=1872666 RepID=UPI002C3C4D6C|nr:PepSY domain-containing protein [Azohydromonas sp.]HMM86490.1 PepSY domain-containing protein [Azohydromonas sp.]